MITKTCTKCKEEKSVALFHRRKRSKDGLEFWCKVCTKIKSARNNSARSATYKTWFSMLQRCTNPNNVGYPYYGGRGIKVCPRWTKYEHFLADMGERPEGTTIDRIDPNGNYEPGNCRWALPTQQANNKRHHWAVAA